MQFATKLKLILVGILLLSSDSAIGFQSEVIVKDTFTAVSYTHLTLPTTPYV